jgi:ABC-type dipeptide/oligopeptide/nickel transport system ATPase component
MLTARAITRPRLLLADEPTTALDVVTQAEVMAILGDQRRANFSPLVDDAVASAARDY